MKHFLRRKQENYEKIAQQAHEESGVTFSPKTNVEKSLQLQSNPKLAQEEFIQRMKQFNEKKESNLKMI